MSNTDKTISNLVKKKGLALTFTESNEALLRGLLVLWQVWEKKFSWQSGVADLQHKSLMDKVTHYTALQTSKSKK